ncbi:MAG TPA: IS1380 family transposase [Gammaproteobacteria bacterium]|nr:IS1380 family transposase [Gammaproteobacteria bacterium]
MTECTQSSFEFQAHFRRQVKAEFDGGMMTSDAGGLLLRETDRRLQLLDRFSECFLDGRDARRVRHSLRELVAQRVYGLALGYEDLNDHEQLRQDPVLKVLAGKEEMAEPLAGKSTLNRLELSAGTADRYKKITFWKDSIDELLVAVFLEAHTEAPDSIVLDIDTTDVALHGAQEGRFFHGYYDQYCYLPLYVFCGEHLLCVRLRRANIDASAGSLVEIQRIVGQIRQRWPAVRITLRGDSGFCREELMSWCEGNGVDYVFGFARNPRLRATIGEALAAAAQQWEQTRQPARVFVEFAYETTTGSWSRARRVVAKAEHIDGKENPRYVVTSLAEQDWPAQKLYEQLYCARGDMENRIKEQFSLFADRVSAETMRANQLRMYFSAIAYVLLCGLRRLGLQSTEMALAQAATIRLRLLRIGAVVRISIRRICLSLPRSYPWPDLFGQVHRALTG